MGEGQLFGKRQFYTGQSRDLDIRAVGFVNLLRIKRDDFMAIIEQFPEDKETFCYIRDRTEQLSYGWASGNSCDSCGSFKHELVDCRFLHYVPNVENICLRQSYDERRDYKQKERRDLSEILVQLGTDQRRVYRECTRFDLNAFTQRWIEQNFEMIDDYKQEHLMYQFDYSYIYKDPHFVIEEEEEEEEEEEGVVVEDDDADEGDNMNGKKNNYDQDEQQNLKENYFQEPSIKLRKGTTPEMKLPKNTEIGQIDTISLEKQILSLESKQISDPQQQVKHSVKKEDFKLRNSTRGQTVQDNNSSNKIKAENPLNSVTLIDPPPPDSISSVNIQNISSASQTQLNRIGSTRQIRQPNHHSSTNIRSGVGNNLSSYSSITSQTNIQSRNINNLPQNKVMSNLNNTNGMGSNMNPLGFHKNGKNMFFNSRLVQQNSKKNQFSKSLSLVIDNLQQSLLHNMQQMMEKNGIHQKQVTRNQFGSGQNCAGLQEIFRFFEKQKNFDIYFPQHNLSYILQRQQKQLDKAKYQQMKQIQNKQINKLNTIGASTSSINYAILRQINQEKYHEKSERFLASPHSLTTNHKINDNNMENSRFKRYAYIESTLPVSREQSPKNADNNLQIHSCKSTFRNKLSFNQFFSKQELSINDFRPNSCISEEIQPSIEEDEVFTQSRPIKIHDFKIESKQNYFNLSP